MQGCVTQLGGHWCGRTVLQFALSLLASCCHPILFLPTTGSFWPSFIFKRLIHPPPSLQ